MILCTLHQWIWSWMHDSDSSVPACTKKHILQCESCRQKIDAMRVVDDVLGKDNAAPSAAWHDAVMKEIRHFDQEVHNSKPAVRALPLSLAALAAVLVVALLVYNSGSSLEKLEKSDGFLSGSVSTLEEMVASLENEGTALEEDARNAARMATQCLPF